MVRYAQTREDTTDIAKELAKTLEGGDVVALHGSLGAGKTTFTQDIAAALGIKERITSPTYVFVRIYPLPTPKRGIKQLCHIDAYRLSDAQELLDVGAGDHIGAPDTLTLIEWADMVPTLIPKRAINVQIRRTGEKRTFFINEKPPK